MNFKEISPLDLKRKLHSCIDEVYKTQSLLSIDLHKATELLYKDTFEGFDIVFKNHMPKDKFLNFSPASDIGKDYNYYLTEAIIDGIMINDDLHNAIEYRFLDYKDAEYMLDDLYDCCESDTALKIVDYIDNFPFAQEDEIILVKCDNLIDLINHFHFNGSYAGIIYESSENKESKAFLNYLDSSYHYELLEGKNDHWISKGMVKPMYLLDKGQLGIIFNQATRGKGAERNIRER